MRLFLFLATFWPPSSAIRCAVGAVIEEGAIVNLDQQMKLLSRYKNTTGVCYFVLTSINCSSGTFNVSAALQPPYSEPDKHLLDCWERNGTVVCSCDEEDYCNIRLYTLLSFLQSDPRTLRDESTNDCYRNLLTASLPLFKPQKDLSDQYKEDKALDWYIYPTIVVVVTNVIGFSFYFVQLIRNCVQKRKEAKEQARILQLNNEAKLKNKSTQYHFLWPLCDGKPLGIIQQPELNSMEETQRVMSQRKMELYMPKDIRSRITVEDIEHIA